MGFVVDGGEVVEEASVMVGWSTWERVDLHQAVRVSWVWASRVRILDALERERRVE